MGRCPNLVHKKKQVKEKVSLKDKGRVTCLQMVIQYGNLEMTKCLLEEYHLEPQVMDEVCVV